jgi:hypothetical protein
MQKLKELKEGDWFTLKEGTDKYYSLTKKVTEGAITYYLTQRAYGNGKTGFWSTDGEKEVCEVLPF